MVRYLVGCQFSFAIEAISKAEGEGMNHTPGPWVVRDCGKHPPGHEAWERCAHLAEASGQALPKTLPNMQLQSAAPDLLESADALLRFIDEHQFHQSGDDVIFLWPPLRDLIEKMRTASAKAMGKV